MGINRWDRLFEAWLKLLAGYSLVILVLVGFRVVLNVWGWLPIPEHDDRRLLHVAIWHVGLGGLLVMMLKAVRWRPESALWRLRAIAAITPVVLLVSADRICAYLAPPRIGTNRVFVPDADLGWRHRPGFRGWLYDYWVEINAKGLRGPELAYERGPNEFRILLLGDSIAFGFGLRYEETFGHLMERDLAERVAGRKPVVILGAVTGYSPWQQLILLRREGLRYQPDLVLHCFYLNDVLEPLQLVRFGGRQSPADVILAEGVLEWSGLYRFAIMSEVQLQRWLHHSQAGEHRELLTELDLLKDPENDLVKQGWQTTLSDLDQIISECRAASVPIAMVCFPYRPQLDPDPPGEPWPQREIAAFCEDRGIPVLDLLPMMRQWADALGDGDIILDMVCHPRAVVSPLIAREIISFLERERLLPGR